MKLWVCEIASYETLFNDVGIVDLDRLFAMDADFGNLGEH
jgi:hypothetical protein